ncbi:MAG: hypothetical protein OHK0056_22910 [Bacteriovoracaceae bacterium]
MSYSDILKLKKEVKSTREKSFVRHIVVGSDLFSVSLYQTLVEKFGANEVKLICDRPISEQELTPQGPSTLRGEASIKLVRKMFPNTELTVVEKPSVFFKDMEFKPFGGRAKSEKLLWSEDFFVAPRAIVNWNELCPILNSPELIAKIESEKLPYILSNILKVAPEDLIAPAHFRLETTKGFDLECEFLYWGKGPLNFLNLFKNKEELSDKFIEFCEQTNTPAKLAIKMVFEIPITDMVETIFIPLSYTHEWGHFIGEFTNLNDGSQVGEFICFVDPEHNDEEELSKKVRALKKSLEKIFEKFSATKYSEYITLSESAPSLTIDDALFSEVAKELDHLKFIATNAPLIHLDIIDHEKTVESREVHEFARSLANYREIVASLN